MTNVGVYINPVAGIKGYVGSNYPREMTRKQVVESTSEAIIGVSDGIGSAFNNHIEWLEEDGNQKIDFRYEDLTLDELGLLDDIVFTCSCCGWSYSADVKYEKGGEAYCDDCTDPLLDD